eukprot:scaffold170_cov281-Pinguiococcus_pyrenoidosus.AAC.13
MDVEEGTQLRADPVEGPRLVAALRLEGVSMHRIAHPEHLLPLALHGTDQARKVLPKLLGTHAHDDGEPAGDVVGVERVDDLQQLVLGALVADLHAERVSNSSRELHVGTVELTSPLADPEHVRGAVVPLPRRAVLAGEGFLIRQEQALMSSVEVRGAERRAGRVHTDRLHEAERLVDLSAQRAVLRALRRLLDEVEVPGVQPGHVRVATGREGAQDVQRLCALVVGIDHPPRVVDARLGRELLSVDVVPAVGRQGHAVARLVRLRARLGELACHAADLDDRHAAAEGQDQRLLENHAEGIADMIDAELVEGFLGMQALTDRSARRSAAGRLAHACFSVQPTAQSPPMSRKPFPAVAFASAS